MALRKRRGKRVCYNLTDVQFNKMMRAMRGRKKAGMPKSSNRTEFGFTSIRPASYYVCGAYARAWAAWADK